MNETKPPAELPGGLKVLRLQPGRDGVAEYRVRGDEAFLRGHFPGQPLFPGVFLVDAAAQLAGLVFEREAPARMLKGLRNVKILGTARPGEVLIFEAQMTRRAPEAFYAQIAASVNGRPILRGEVALGR